MKNDEVVAGLVRVQPNNLSKQKPHDFYYRHFALRNPSLGLLVLVCSACSAQEDASEFRFWTTSNGRKSEVELKLVEKTSTTVKLKRRDNDKVIEFRIDQLSDTDQQYLRRSTRRVGDSNRSAQRAKLQGSDWTRFRGPGGSCVSADESIPIEWSATKNLSWKVALPGRGASSPVTWRDRVYVTCYTGYGLDVETPGEMADLERHLLCIRRSDGEILWKKTMPSKAPVAKYDATIAIHGYATHTPTVDASGVYVFYGSTGAASYSHSGALRWHESCGTETHGYGTAASPILSDDVLIVSAIVESGAILGMDTRTGREVWQLKVPRKIWCTPIIVRDGDSAELVCFKEVEFVVGLDPTTGQELWEYQTTTHEGRYVTTSPVKYSDAIITAQGGYGANAFRFGGRGNVTESHMRWTSAGIYGTPLVFQDRLVTPFRGVLRICDAKTGPGRDKYFRLNPSNEGYSSAVIAGNKLYWAYKEDGVCVVQLSAEPKQLAHNVLEGDTSVFNATPAISNGQLFLRSDKFLYCIEKE